MSMVEIHLPQAFFPFQMNALHSVLDYEFYFILRTTRTTSVFFVSVWQNVARPVMWHPDLRIICRGTGRPDFPPAAASRRKSAWRGASSVRHPPLSSPLALDRASDRRLRKFPLL